MQWAARRTFVLQDPGTEVQTITNVVAESVMSEQRVLFVAEKGRRWPWSTPTGRGGSGALPLNLHHEGSNAAEVQAQLKALTYPVNPDPTAMESARRLAGRSVRN